jgi:hypothetical protein
VLWQSLVVELREALPRHRVLGPAAPFEEHAASAKANRHRAIRMGAADCNRGAGRIFRDRAGVGGVPTTNRRRTDEASSPRTFRRERFLR